MKFEKTNFKELYVSKFGKELDWDNLDEFAKLICEHQKDEIVHKYKEHSTTLSGEMYVNRPFLEDVSGGKTSCDLDSDEQKYF